ncbi:DMT family transporter [Kitasatospora sp. NBC_01287]|uniref:DMT family transporter n=1 Tax=Kitasatospora sp. NBC_01287 TaxID=2903573 RepID=UPI00224F9B2A|nr:DMT family transporter [Kitasatospora sp. NBC_01287]MCX4751666.1 DMT family transporter [Kitasatospora sp. NBC_01287]
MHTPLAVLFALLTTVFNALATVLQRKAAGRVPLRGMGRGLFPALLRQRVWLGGMVAVAAAACCQALALANGPLSIVQPIFVLELLIALLLAGLILRRPLPPRTWQAAGWVTAGLGVALWAAAPSGDGPSAGFTRWLLATVSCLGLVALLTAVAARRGAGPVRAACLALGAALCYALTAAMLKASALAWQRGGLTAFLTVWQTYGFALIGVLALFLLENALQSGQLVFSQPALTLGDACASVALGMTLFGERIRTGGWVAVELLGVAAVAVGVVLLSQVAGAQERAAAAAPEPAADSRR